jgi:hypothetical protein
MWWRTVFAGGLLALISVVEVAVAGQLESGEATARRANGAAQSDPWVKSDLCGESDPWAVAPPSVNAAPAQSDPFTGDWAASTAPQSDPWASDPWASDPVASVAEAQRMAREWAPPTPVPSAE